MKEEVIFTEITSQSGNIGKILLNRPQNLNALTLDMVVAIKAQLDHWAQDNRIKAVIIQGAGERAFCAGGDIRAVYRSVVEEKNPQKAASFFQSEYQMNSAIFHFPKSYVAFLDGVTMGGGVGVSIHGSFPIATERFQFAMPETGIGFFPDIGAGYHLEKLPDNMGFYLSLTGNRIAAMDAYRLNLVKAVVPSKRLADLENALINTQFSGKDFHVVKMIIASFHVQLAEEANSLTERFAAISQYFNEETVEKIIAALQNSADLWLRSIAETLVSRSPISLKVTHQHIKNCRNLNFDEVIAENLCLNKHFLGSHDFMEGIRAVLVDKDRRPQWQPSTLAEVSNVMVQNYFKN